MARACTRAPHGGRRSPTPVPGSPRRPAPRAPRARPGLRDGDAPGPHSHALGHEQAALHHHVREEIQLEGRSHVRGARGGRRRARPSGRGRRDGQGQVRAASARRPPEPARVTFSALARPAAPRPGEREATGCGAPGAASGGGAPRLTPARPRGPPAAAGGAASRLPTSPAVLGRPAPRNAACAADSALFRSAPHFQCAWREAQELPVGGFVPNANMWPKAWSPPGQNQTPQAT